MLKGFGRMFEWILWNSRYAILLAVIASVVSAFMLIVVGLLDTYYIAGELFHLLTGMAQFEQFSKMAITHVISAIDAFLIATVLFIFGMGLYELFISKIEDVEKETRSSKIFIIHTLDDLKEKLVKVILMALIVMFFKHAAKFPYDEILHLLYLSIGILLLSLSVYLMHKSLNSGRS